MPVHLPCFRFKVRAVTLTLTQSYLWKLQLLHSCRHSFWWQLLQPSDTMFVGSGNCRVTGGGLLAATLAYKIRAYIQQAWRSVRSKQVVLLYMHPLMRIEWFWSLRSAKPWKKSSEFIEFTQFNQFYYCWELNYHVPRILRSNVCITFNMNCISSFIIHVFNIEQILDSWLKQYPSFESLETFLSIRQKPFSVEISQFQNHFEILHSLIFKHIQQQKQFVHKGYRRSALLLQSSRAVINGSI